ncbi:MAG TPA: helix-turn-helix domain-containing protein, partial [Thermoplasmata archaeon]|nr:helix-turn-helix domain-containing protein [Thermoplasmata archaeon]
MRPRGVGHERRPVRPASAATAELSRFPLIEVRFDRRGRAHPLSELFDRAGAEVRLLACRLSARRPRRLVRWLDLEVDDEQFDPLVRSIRRRLGARSVALARLGPDRALLRVSEPAPAVCTATHDAGGICVSCPLLTGSEGDPWRVVLPRGGQARSFVRGAPAGNPGAGAVVRVEPYRSATSLTRRQDRALRIAYTLGYFDYPRRGSLGDVARSLGVGRSTALEILR